MSKILIQSSCGECAFFRKRGYATAGLHRYLVGMCVLEDRNWTTRMDQPACIDFKQKEST